MTDEECFEKFQKLFLEGARFGAEQYKKGNYHEGDGVIPAGFILDLDEFIEAFGKAKEKYLENWGEPMPLGGFTLDVPPISEALEEFVEHDWPPIIYGGIKEGDPDTVTVTGRFSVYAHAQGIAYYPPTGESIQQWARQTKTGLWSYHKPKYTWKYYWIRFKAWFKRNS